MSDALLDRALAALKETLADPRKLRDVAERTVALGRGRISLRSCERGRRVRAFGDVRVVAGGRIALGDLVFFLGGMLPSELICHRGAEIVIGEGSGFNYGVSIEAHRRITIGKRCIFGTMVRVEDTTPGVSAPITICDGVWVAHGAVIGPGVTIGAGSVVSAGSVVVNDVPPNRLAVGNPARPVPLDVKRAHAEREP